MSMRLVFLVALLSVLGFAPAPFPRPNRSAQKGDLKKLQGDWIGIEHHRAGQKLPEKVGSMQLSVVNDRWTFSSDGRVASEWTARLDPAATPRAVDLMSPTRGGGTILGIYRFEGDKLYFAYEGQTRRPTGFDTSDGWLMVLKRR